MEIVAVLASLAFVVALAAVIYPFRPFGKRRNAIFTAIGSFLAVGIAAPPSDSESAVAAVSVQESQALVVPSDSNAKYYVRGIVRRSDGLIEIDTRREGPSGTSFAVRLVQCEPLLSGYIAEADTEADLVRNPAPELSVLVADSISDVIAKHACTNTDAPMSTIVTKQPVEATEDQEAQKRAKMEADVRRGVDALRWSDARVRYQMLSNAGLVTDEFKNEIESQMIELVRPLPASEREANLEGYQFLAAVRPENSDYAAKIESYEQAIAAERMQAVSILRKKEDRIEGITWYQHPNQPKYLNSRSTAFLYIGRQGDLGRPWLRLKVQYTSSDWLFVERVTAWHDGVKEPLISGSFERDNNSTIWEWMDVAPDEYQVEVLRSLAHAEDAILRFEGDQYHRDVTLSSSDKKALRDVLVAFEVMKSGS